MAVRASWAVGSDTERIQGLEDGRAALSALLAPGAGFAARTGWIPGRGGTSPGRVTASTPTADHQVHVTGFQRVHGNSRGVYPYIATVDSSTPVNVLLAYPADPANTRHDLIVAQQSDAASHGDPDSLYRVRHIVGTPASSPTDPAVDGSPDYVVLARVVVTPGMSAVTSADIVDLRPAQWTVAVGGLLPVTSIAERNAVAAYPGMCVLRMDAPRTPWTEVHDGTAWRIQGVPVVEAVADLSTLITDPQDGDLAMVGPTDQIYQYDVSSWSRYPRDESFGLQSTTTFSVTSASFTSYAASLSGSVTVGPIGKVDLSYGFYGRPTPPGGEATRLLRMQVMMSGANTGVPLAASMCGVRNPVNGYSTSESVGAFTVTGLAEGSTTFTAQFAVSSDTASIEAHHLSVRAIY